MQHAISYSEKWRNSGFPISTQQVNIFIYLYNKSILFSSSWMICSNYGHKWCYFSLAVAFLVCWFFDTHKNVLVFLVISSVCLMSCCRGAYFSVLKYYAIYLAFVYVMQWILYMYTAVAKSISVVTSSSCCRFSS
jgi:hypothetical protein